MNLKLYVRQQGLKAVAHLILFILAFYLSFGLRFNFEIPFDQWEFFLKALPFVIIVKMLLFWRFSMFRPSWRYASLKDLIDLVRLSAISSLVAVFAIYTLWLHSGFPRSIMILDLILSIVLIGGARLSLRVVFEKKSFMKKAKGEKVIIVGAGNSGESISREIIRNSSLQYQIAAFFDDDPSKIGMRIHGVQVYGPIDDIIDFSKTNNIKKIFIAISLVTRGEMLRIVELCRKTGCEVKTVPGIEGLINGKISVSQLREVRIEDLLGRDIVQLGTRAICDYLKDRTVMVTGAAGSIGSEICRQVLNFEPARLVLFDQSETGLFEIQNELLEKRAGSEIKTYVGDICDLARVEFIMNMQRPEVVFHAAAYKHVPLMEENPTEAIKNNVIGTKIVADLAQKYRVGRFVFISTDKAVNPSSIMGATKRVAELYIRKISLQNNNGTKFMAVRFGNVMDSAGSVIGIFRRQIAAGGPVTVTHPEMTRYFMTIPEASHLVLQAASMGKGGEMFVLNMGEPIKIFNLAKDMIRLYGYEPGRDIPIEFIGVRDGEKLHEELWYKDDLVSTGHQKIFVNRSFKELPKNFDSYFEFLVSCCRDGNDIDINLRLKEILPEYRLNDQFIGI